MKKWQDRGIWARTVNCEKVTRKIKTSLTKPVYTDFSWPQDPVSGDKDYFPSFRYREPFTWEFYPLLSGRKKDGWSALLASVVLQVP